MYRERHRPAVMVYLRTYVCVCGKYTRRDMYYTIIVQNGIYHRMVGRVLRFSTCSGHGSHRNRFSSIFTLYTWTLVSYTMSVCTLYRIDIPSFLIVFFFFYFRKTAEVSLQKFENRTRIFSGWQRKVSKPSRSLVSRVYSPRCVQYTDTMIVRRFQKFIIT